MDGSWSHDVALFDRTLSFESFRVDPARRLLYRDDEVVPLTSKVFEVLLALAGRAGEVVTKEELFRAAWPDCAVEDSSLTVAISTLRKALGETPHQHRFILTIPGQGYKFVCPIVRETTRTDAGAAGRAAPAARAEAGESLRPRLPARVRARVAGSRIAAPLVAGLASGALVLLVSSAGTSPTTMPPDVTHVPAAVSEASVLDRRGHELLERRVEDELRLAVLLFDRAIELEADRAAAHAGRASAYAILGILGMMRPLDAFPVAKSAAQSALRLDPASSEAHAVMGLIRDRFEWNWRAAEADFKRAVGIDPTFARAWHWYARFLSRQGRMDEAVAAARTARRLNPLSPVINANAARIVGLGGSPAEGRAICGEVVAQDPTSWMGYFHLGATHAASGEYDLARSAYARAATLSSQLSTAVANLARLQVAAGDRAGARHTLRQLEEVAKRRYVSPLHIAMVNAILGDTPAALGWLEDAVEGRAIGLERLAEDAAFDALRDEPRFRAVVREVQSRATTRAPRGVRFARPKSETVTLDVPFGE